MIFEIEKLDSCLIIRTKQNFIGENELNLLVANITRFIENGDINLALDFSEIKQLETSMFEKLIEIHVKCIEVNGTLVIFGIQENEFEVEHSNQIFSKLNLTPTEQEAVDFIILNEIEKSLDLE